MSELAKYHKHNPDPMYGHCVNSGMSEDGVVFPGVEVIPWAFCFIGRSSIIEAAAELYGITPNEAKVRLESSAKPRKRKVEEPEIT